MQSPANGQEKTTEGTDIALAKIKEMGGSAKPVISKRNLMGGNRCDKSMIGEIFSDDSLRFLHDL